MTGLGVAGRRGTGASPSDVGDADSGALGGRAGLELIELGDTNARYRTIDDLHMVVKNRGSLVYAALAGSRSAAEDLILSAIADQ